MKYTLTKSKVPAYIQLYSQMRNDIINGIYKYNEKLPSKRLLAEELGISTVTAEHAYALLCDEGYARAEERSGYYTAFRLCDGFAGVSPEKEHDVYIINSEQKHDNGRSAFSISVLSKTMRKVITDYGDGILKKPPNSGCIEFRNALKYYLARNRGINVGTQQIIVGSGAEYLYSMIISLLGRDKTYAIEHPSYEKIEQVYRASGVKYELLPLSDDGIDSAALLKSNADVLHTTPYRSFPSGVTASASKRHEYLRWADKNTGYIVESDYDSEFSVSSKPTETLFSLSKNENVIYLNTFSKTISPSFRVGYMVLPKSLVGSFNEKLGFFSCTVPTFEQLVLTELLNSGSFERHINKVRRFKRKETKKQ